METELPSTVIHESTLVTPTVALTVDHALRLTYRRSSKDIHFSVKVKDTSEGQVEEQVLSEWSRKAVWYEECVGVPAGSVYVEYSARQWLPHGYEVYVAIDNVTLTPGVCTDTGQCTWGMVYNNIFCNSCICGICSLRPFVPMGNIGH